MLGIWDNFDSQCNPMVVEWAAVNASSIWKVRLTEATCIQKPMVSARPWLSTGSIMMVCETHKERPSVPFLISSSTSMVGTRCACCESRLLQAPWLFIMCRASGSVLAIFQIATGSICWICLNLAEKRSVSWRASFSRPFGVLNCLNASARVSLSFWG